MIVRRIILAVVSLALLAAAAGTMVVAAAFALYALLRTWLTPAETGAVVAFAAAVIAGGAALLLTLSARRPRLRPRRSVAGAASVSPMQFDRLIAIVRERPFVSAGAAVAAGLIVIANPRIATAVVRAFLDPRSPER